MLEWYVYKTNPNTNEIEKFNIFNHTRFAKEIKELSCDCKNEEIRRILFYYYGSKFEYEILISPWSNRDCESRVVDIYNQVILNASQFYEYIQQYLWGRENAEK